MYLKHHETIWELQDAYDTPIEPTLKIAYREIQDLVDKGRLSERMGYCGQQGFNFTQVSERDLETVQELTDPKD